MSHGGRTPAVADGTGHQVREQSRMAVERYLRRALPDDLVPHVALLGVDDKLSGRAGREAKAALAAPGVLVPVQLIGDAALIGPFRSAGRACFHCLARRWQSLRPAEERDALELGWPVGTVGVNAGLTTFTLDTITCVIRTLVGNPRRSADPFGNAYVYEVRYDTQTVHRYPLLADSDCPACGSRPPDTAEGATMALRPRRKRSPNDLRLRSLESYSLPVDAYLNPVCGALGRGPGYLLGCSTTAPAVGYVGVRGPEYIHNAIWGGHADSFDRSARVGLLEGLERHAGLRPRRTATAVTARFRDIEPDAVDPRVCGVYPDAYYAKDPECVPFTPDLETTWVWGWSLRDKRAVLVAECATYYHLSHATGRFVRECSSGCAAGSCAEEAILHGMLELIERDAFLLSWYGGAALPELDATTCANPATRFMIDRIARCGYTVRLFDTRIDLPVPVVTAVAVRPDGGPGTLLFGAGAAFDPEEAVRSAVYETALMAPEFGTQSAWAAPELREMAADYWKVRVLHNHQRLFGLPEMAYHADFLLGGASRTGPRPPGSAPGARTSIADAFAAWNIRPTTTDLLDDLTFCVDALVAGGFDVVVVDQTSPEQALAGLSTVRVVVPGLLPIDFGWAKQRVLHMPRLFTAFRRAGWRSTDLHLSELHTVPHPFP